MEVNASSQVMGLVQEELRIARELEAAYPNLAEQADISSSILDDSLNNYFYKITATAESGATSTGWAKETEVAAMILSTSNTPTLKPSLTATPLPSRTPEPQVFIPNATATLQPEATTNTMPTGAVLVVEIIVFAIVGFIVYRRLLRKP
jgi:hypothetical protein